MPLQQIHRGIVNTTQARGIIHTPPLAIGIGIHSPLVTMRTSNTNLTHLNGLPLAFRGSLDIEFRGRKHFHAILAHKAVEGGEPILVFIERQRQRFGKLAKRTLRRLDNLRINHRHAALAPRRLTLRRSLRRRLGHVGHGHPLRHSSLLHGRGVRGGMSSPLRRGMGCVGIHHHGVAAHHVHVGVHAHSGCHSCGCPGGGLWRTARVGRGVSCHGGMVGHAWVMGHAWVVSAGGVGGGAELVGGGAEGSAAGDGAHGVNGVGVHVGCGGGGHTSHGRGHSWCGCPGCSSGILHAATCRWRTTVATPSSAHGIHATMHLMILQFHPRYKSLVFAKVAYPPLFPPRRLRSGGTSRITRLTICRWIVGIIVSRISRMSTAAFGGQAVITAVRQRLRLMSLWCRTPVGMCRGPQRCPSRGHGHLPSRRSERRSSSSSRRHGRRRWHWMATPARILGMSRSPPIDKRLSIRISSRPRIIREVAALARSTVRTDHGHVRLVLHPQGARGNGRSRPHARHCRGAHAAHSSGHSAGCFGGQACFHGAAHSRCTHSGAAAGSGTGGKASFHGVHAGGSGASR
mmetsp:Transcript_2332/g.4962  ORF Transcript_2332/g.4962 Transcript_2332/m.4962 type:complete len:573 (-) Transcript_2332:635-2353(-)